MGYNKELFAEIRRRMEEGRLRALEEAENRRHQIHTRLPEVAGIDRELARTGLMIMEEISKGKEGLSERLENIRLDNLDLQAQREACLIRAGYPADYDQPPYNCKICKDSGYNGQQMCTCLKTMLSKEGMKRAGVDRLFETQRFETFRLQYYQQDARVLQLMKTQLDFCRRYADRFDKDTKEN